MTVCDEALGVYVTAVLTVGFCVGVVLGFCVFQWFNDVED